MNLLSSSTTATGTIAATYPDFGLRPSDGWLVDVLAEMKVNYETLNRLAFVQLINGNAGSTAVPILGGYAGGAPGTALVKTAYFLVGMHVFRGAYHVTLPIHFNLGCNSMREALWVFAVTGRPPAATPAIPLSPSVLRQPDPARKCTSRKLRLSYCPRCRPDMPQFKPPIRQGGHR